MFSDFADFRKIRRKTDSTNSSPFRLATLHNRKQLDLPKPTT